MRLHIFDTVLLLAWMQPQSLYISFMGQLGSYRFQWLHVMALRSSVCASHIICQSWTDLHKTHATIFSLSSSCTLQEVQLCGYIPGTHNVLFVYWLIIFPTHFSYTLTVCVFFCECSLLQHEVPSLLTSGAARASCRQMAQSTKRGLGSHRICL